MVTVAILIIPSLLSKGECEISEVTNLEGEATAK
jgi:hypothetical protein